MNRKCHFCDKVFDKLNALVCHMYSCKIRFRTNRRKIFYRETEKHKNAYANIYNIVKLFNEDDRTKKKNHQSQ